MTSLSSRPDLGPSRLLGWFVVAALLALTSGACGGSGSGDDGTVPVGYPTIAPLVVNGTFELVEATAEDKPVTIGVPPLITIDVVTGGLEADLGCNRYLGSYTLNSEGGGDEAEAAGKGGTASFTFAGGTSQSCPDGGAAEKTLLDIFDRVDGWKGDGAGLTLTSSIGDRIELRRLAGT